MIRVEKSRRTGRKPWRVTRVRKCPGEGCAYMHPGRPEVEHRSPLAAFWTWPEAMRYANKVARIFPKAKT